MRRLENWEKWIIAVVATWIYSLLGLAASDIFVVSDRSGDVLVEGETMPAGTHTATWTGRDSQGRAMPSGTYFYRLEAGGYVETRRMTLIR